MILDENSKVNFVGGFNGTLNEGFISTLTKLQESFSSVNHLDYIKNIGTIMGVSSLSESYKNILLEDYSADLAEMGEELSPLQEQNFQKLEALVEMAKEEIVNESGINNLDPIVGLTFPLLKLYWIKNVFKDFVPTVTANKPAFILGLEKRYVQFESGGKKWYLPEAYNDPTFDLSGYARKKLSRTEITVPQLNYSILEKIAVDVDHVTLHKTDKISVSLFIDSVTYDNGAAFKGIAECRIMPNPADGSFKFDLMNGELLVDVLQGSVDFETSTVTATSVMNKIKSFTVEANLSSENHQRTPMVGWEKETRPYRIPDGDHIATGITREKMKDEKAIYNVDTTAKIMEMMNDVVSAERDKKVLNFLDASKDRLKANRSDFFITEEFDFKPPARLTNITNTEWVRQELKETLDKLAQDMGTLLKNETCIISVMGNPKDVRALADISWVSSKGNGEIGGCRTEYKCGIYNGMRNFIIGSSERIPAGKLKIYMYPMNEDHMTYKIFEYQFIVSNEYRRSDNYAEPSIMVSDRFLIDEHTPLQGEISILNNKISSSQIFNDGSSVIANGDDLVNKLAAVLNKPVTP